MKLVYINLVALIAIALSSPAETYVRKELDPPESVKIDKQKGEKSLSVEPTKYHKDVAEISKVGFVEVWAGKITKVSKNAIGKPNVISPIEFGPAKLVMPESELSSFAKTLIDHDARVKPVVGMKNLYEWNYIYYDEPKEFPSGRLPEIGEIWIFTGTRGKHGGLELISAKRLE